MAARSRKAAVPVSGEGFVIRIAFPQRRIGVKKAERLAQICKANGMHRVVVYAEARWMLAELDNYETIEQKINPAIRELGFQLIKSTKITATYEWKQHQVKR
jgi:hypothetical protein